MPTVQVKTQLPTDELARLRNTTLTALMKKLDIRKPRYA